MLDAVSQAKSIVLAYRLNFPIKDELRSVSVFDDIPTTARCAYCGSLFNIWFVDEANETYFCSMLHAQLFHHKAG